MTRRRRKSGRRACSRLQCRKRQHVGRLVDAAPVAVQRPDAGIVGQHDRDFGFADIGIGDLGRGIDGAMDYRLGVRLGLPAIGDDENFGERKNGRHERSSALHCNVRVTARARLQQARRRQFLGQDFPVAGFCGNPS